MIIDCHSHFSRPIDEKLSRMDAAGIDRSILVVATGNPETADDAASYATEVANTRRHVAWDGTDRYVSDAFDEMLAASTRSSDRFIPLAPALFGADRDAVEAWTASALEAGCAGFGELMPTSGGMASAETTVAVAQDAGGLLFLVSSYPPTTADDIRCIGELGRRYPSNAFVIGHLGATHTLIACAIAQQIPNVYIDTSTHPNLLALRHCLREVPHKLLFGTNDPYCSPDLARRGIEALAPHRATRAGVLADTCEELLGRLGGARLAGIALA